MPNDKVHFETPKNFSAVNLINSSNNSTGSKWIIGGDNCQGTPNLDEFETPTIKVLNNKENITTNFSDYKIKKCLTLPLKSLMLTDFERSNNKNNLIKSDELEERKLLKNDLKTTPNLRKKKIVFKKKKFTTSLPDASKREQKLKKKLSITPKVSRTCNFEDLSAKLHQKKSKKPGNVENNATTKKEQATCDIITLNLKRPFTESNNNILHEADLNNIKTETNAKQYKNEVSEDRKALNTSVQKKFKMDKGDNLIQSDVEQDSNHCISLETFCENESQDLLDETESCPNSIIPSKEKLTVISDSCCDTNFFQHDFEDSTDKIKFVEAGLLSCRDKVIPHKKEVIDDDFVGKHFYLASNKRIELSDNFFSKGMDLLEDFEENRLCFGDKLSDLKRNIEKSDSSKTNSKRSGNIDLLMEPPVFGAKSNPTEQAKFLAVAAEKVNNFDGDAANFNSFTHEYENTPLKNYQKLNIPAVLGMELIEPNPFSVTKNKATCNKQITSKLNDETETIELLDTHHLTIKANLGTSLKEAQWEIPVNSELPNNVSSSENISLFSIKLPPFKESANIIYNKLIENANADFTHTTGKLSGFKTGHGTEIKPPSKKNLDRIRHIFNEDGNTSKEPQYMAGFTNGFGNPIALPSIDAVSRVSNLFSDLATKTEASLNGNVKVPGILVKESKNAAEHSQNGFCENIESLKKKASLDGGFQNALGQAIKPPSHSAMTSVEFLFNEGKNHLKTKKISTEILNPLPDFVKPLIKDFKNDSIHNNLTSGVSKHLTNRNLLANRKSSGKQYSYTTPVNIAQKNLSSRITIKSSTDFLPKKVNSISSDTSNSIIPKLNLKNTPLSTFSHDNSKKKLKIEAPSSKNETFDQSTNLSNNKAMQCDNEEMAFWMETKKVSEENTNGGKLRAKRTKAQVANSRNKRKFVTPLIIHKEKAIASLKTTPVVQLSKEVKTNKIQHPVKVGRSLLTWENLLSLNLPDEVLNMSYEKAKTFFFKINESRFGTDEAFNELINAGCTGITHQWVSNHYSLIVWKLACFYRTFPDLKYRWCWNEVLKELNLRYEVEVNQARRSSLKLITEMDDLPAKYMVLAVCDIINDDYKENKSNVTDMRLVLTDGWYTITALLDDVLVKAVTDGRIKLGYKLAICGAQLIGASEGCPPLNIPSSTCLKLSSNSTRLANWEARLGYQKLKSFTTSLRSINSNGGTVPCIDVIIEKIYPTQYMEELNDSKMRIFRSKKDEEVVEREWQNDYAEQFQETLKKLNFENILNPEDYYSLSQNLSFEDLQNDPAHLFCNMSNSTDAASYINSLSMQQQTILRNFVEEETAKKRETVIKEATFQVEELKPKRKVFPVVKIRVCDYPPLGTSRKIIFWGNITLWKYDSVMIDSIKEGHRFKIHNVAVSPNSGRIVDDLFCTATLSAFSSKTVFEEVSIDAARLALTPYKSRTYLTCFDIIKSNPGVEVDTICIIAATTSPKIITKYNGTKEVALMLLCTDNTEKIVIVEVFMPFADIKTVAEEFKPKSLVIFRNLKYIFYYEKIGTAKLNAHSLLSEKRTVPKGETEIAQYNSLVNWMADESALQNYHEILVTYTTVGKSDPRKNTSSKDMKKPVDMKPVSADASREYESFVGFIKPFKRVVPYSFDQENQNPKKDDIGLNKDKSCWMCHFENSVSSRKILLSNEKLKQLISVCLPSEDLRIKYIAYFKSVFDVELDTKECFVYWLLKHFESKYYRESQLLLASISSRMALEPIEASINVLIGAKLCFIFLVSTTEKFSTRIL
ncbi:Breast cancer 2, early onset [Lobulomyces angularis]|nr:Breast cancer 2, early onset [Lobulomyces angularis]